MDDRLSVIRQLQQTIERALAPLSVTDWQKPTPCEGWTVAHVVAHLAVQADLFAGSCENALRGDAAAAWPEAAAGRAAYHEARDRRIDALAAAGGQAALRSFQETGERLNALLEQVAPEDLARPAWTPAGPGKADFYFSARLAELAIHGWDIQDALQAGDLMPAETHAALVGYLSSRLPRLFDPAGITDLPGDVLFDFGRAGALALVAGPGLATVATAAAQPRLTIRTDREAFILVAAGRRTVPQMQAAGRWQSSGDAALADRINGAFKGF